MSERTWRIVTPEAVALDLEAAGLASRILAELIDVMVMGVVLYALLIVTSLSALVAGSGVIIAVLGFVGLFLLLLAWPMAWELGTHGRSIGKMALGLRVVTLEGAPIRFRHALVRGLAGLVELDFTLGTVALIVAMGSRRFRRLGDHLAGTVVVRERSGSEQAQAIRFHPAYGWESFADGLDVSRLTSGHHRLIRSYLLRAPRLDPKTRWQLGYRILDQIADDVSMSAAVRASVNGHDPVQALTAVAAAYQRRFSPDPYVFVVPWR